MKLTTGPAASAVAKDTIELTRLVGAVNPAICQLLRTDRSPVVISLCFIAPETKQIFRLTGGLNAFRDGADSQRFCHADDCRNLTVPSQAAPARVKAILCTGVADIADGITLAFSLGGSGRYIRVDSANIEDVVPHLSALERLVNTLLPSLLGLSPKAK
ncbi:hypothetical protein [Burkholderia sp. BC1]|uniref:hypothetical protein n=1 Tax=Burkholderia sp. BC1 TaxID=1095370 RepID=UPI004044EA78